jgi:hypothetical protein
MKYLFNFKGRKSGWKQSILLWILSKQTKCQTIHSIEKTSAHFESSVIEIRLRPTQRWTKKA